MLYEVEFLAPDGSKREVFWMEDPSPQAMKDFLGCDKLYVAVGYKELVVYGNKRDGAERNHVACSCAFPKEVYGNAYFVKYDPSQENRGLTPLLDMVL